MYKIKEYYFIIFVVCSTRNISAIKMRNHNIGDGKLHPKIGLESPEGE